MRKLMIVVLTVAGICVVVKGIATGSSWLIVGGGGYFVAMLLLFPKVETMDGS